jgi:hypothetical protein
VIERRYAEYTHRLKDRVDERRDGGPMAENNQTAHEHDHQQERQEPEFFPDAYELPELQQEIHHVS